MLFLDYRKVFDSTKEEKLLNVSHDHDLDKYKRRPALQWFARWFRSEALLCAKPTTCMPEIQ